MANATANRFSSVTSVVRATTRTARPLRVLLLADELPIGAVRDHIDAINKKSRHRIFMVNPIKLRKGWWAQLVDFDAILIHYSICILFDYFLPPAVRELIRNFRGPKIQIIQDECRWVDRMARAISDLGIDAVFSSLAVETLPRVYHHNELHRVRFYSSLPGYVPGRYLRLNAPPVSERGLHLIYRGQQLPPWYGREAKEKHQIGEHGVRIVTEHRLAGDIKTREEDRIFGKTWISFLTSGKAVLGVEGGVSVFDFDESVQRCATEFAGANPDATWDEIWEAAVRPHEGNIIHRTITPRIFEAILCRTALVLYPGHFRGLLRPWEHYIPLARDGSNETEVARHLRNDPYLQELVDRAHARIVHDPVLRFKTYVSAIDSVFDDLSKQRASAKSTFPFTTVRKPIALGAANVAKHLEVLHHWSEQRQVLQQLHQLQQQLRPRVLAVAAVDHLLQNVVPQKHQSRARAMLRVVANSLRRVCGVPIKIT
jgi:hypothetical protein